MNDIPWLTLLVVIPLLGAGAVVLIKDHAVARRIAMGTSVLTLVWAAIALVTDFSADGAFHLSETYEWIPAIGVHWALGLDGLGAMMVLLTSVLVPLVLVASWHQGRTFFAWVLALEAAALAVFCATDVFLFYVVFEATLIPAYFLIGGFGGAGRARAATKFLLYQLAGGLVLLGGVIGLYVVSADAGNPSYLLSDLAGLDIDPGAQKWLFVAFFFAFAVKAPLFPVHTWLADTAEQATPPTSVLLVCVLDKIGTFAMIRFCLEIFPDASRWATPVVIALALVSIIYGALVAIGQDDILRLVGLTSLSHFGLIVLGIFAFNTTGLTGAVLYMFNHGIATALLFLVAGALIQRTGTRSIRAMGSGWEKKVPLLAGVFLVAGLAACGLPGLSPFVSEIMVIAGAFNHHWLAGSLAVLVIVLAAFYALWLYQRPFTGPPSTGAAAPALGEVSGAPATSPAPHQLREPMITSATDLTRLELVVLAPLVVALLVFGFWPGPILDLAEPVATAILGGVR